MSHNHSRLTQLVSAGASATATDDNENDERFQPPQHYHEHIHEEKTESPAQMNMRGVFLHVLADALGSVIVIVSASVRCVIPVECLLQPLFHLLNVLTHF